MVNPGSDYTFPEFGVEGGGERGSARRPLEDPSDFVEETSAAGNAQGQQRSHLLPLPPAGGPAVSWGPRPTVGEGRYKLRMTLTHGVGHPEARRAARRASSWAAILPSTLALRKLFTPLSTKKNKHS